MILILSTCIQKLSEREFVEPVKRILKAKGIDFVVKRYYESFEPGEYSCIIICGTSLMDFGYMENQEKFSWINGFEGRLLGICSGAQMLVLSAGCSLQPTNLIGKKDVSIRVRNILAKGKIGSYFLVTQKATACEGIEMLDEEGYIFRRKGKEHYGVLFHPEVLNKEIIENFCS